MPRQERNSAIFTVYRHMSKNSFFKKKVESFCFFAIVASLLAIVKAQFRSTKTVKCNLFLYFHGHDRHEPCLALMLLCFLAFSCIGTIHSSSPGYSMPYLNGVVQVISACFPRYAYGRVTSFFAHTRLPFGDDFIVPLIAWQNYFSHKLITSRK